MNYMLLVTAPSAKFILKAPLREVQAHARLYAHRHPNHSLVAPPIELRSFQKLDQHQLLHIAYGLGVAPEGELDALRVQVYEVVEALKEDPTPLTALEKDVKRLALPEPDLSGDKPPKADPAPPKPKKERLPSVGGVPNPESTTGKVWKVAEDLFILLGRLPTSKEVVAKCTELGISSGTASVQYGKWKGSKN